MSGLLGRLLAIVLAATAVSAGCVASDAPSHSATVQAKRVDRGLAASSDGAGTTTVAPATTATPPEPSRQTDAGAPRTRTTRSGAGVAPAAPAAARATPAWARYQGQLTGGTYYVARALGSALPVSTAADAAPATSLSNPLPSGAPRVVVVVDDPGGDWLQVLLPMRPNSSVGWIRRSDVEVTRVHHRVEIDRAAHRLRVFDGGESLIADEPIAVGKPSTPTPPGQFFTVELLQPANPGGAYGPYAFTLSAYSEVYQTFGSGDGAVGVHGTNEPGSIGRDASHGCVRLNNGAIQRLASILPLGAPVFIR